MTKLRPLTPKYLGKLIIKTLRSAISTLNFSVGWVTRNTPLFLFGLMKKREELGEFHLIVQELKLDSEQRFLIYFRITPIMFDELLS